METPTISNANQFEVIDINGELRIVSLDELQTMEQQALEFDGFTGHMNRGSLNSFLTENYVPKSEAHTKEDVIDAYYAALDQSNFNDLVGNEECREEAKRYYNDKFPNHTTTDKQIRES